MRCVFCEGLQRVLYGIRSRRDWLREELHVFSDNSNGSVFSFLGLKVGYLFLLLNLFPFGFVGRFIISFYIVFGGLKLLDIKGVTEGICDMG